MFSNYDFFSVSPPCVWTVWLYKVTNKLGNKMKPKRTTKKTILPFCTSKKFFLSVFAGINYDLSLQMHSSQQSNTFKTAPKLNICHCIKIKRHTASLPWWHDSSFSHDFLKAVQNLCFCNKCTNTWASCHFELWCSLLDLHFKTSKQYSFHKSPSLLIGLSQYSIDLPECVREWSSFEVLWNCWLERGWCVPMKSSLFFLHSLARLLSKAWMSASASSPLVPRALHSRNSTLMGSWLNSKSLPFFPKYTLPPPEPSWELRAAERVTRSVFLWHDKGPL